MLIVRESSTITRSFFIARNRLRQRFQPLQTRRTTTVFLKRWLNPSIGCLVIGFNLEYTRQILKTKSEISYRNEMIQHIKTIYSQFSEAMRG